MSKESADTPSSEEIRLRGEREYFLHRGEYNNPYALGSAEFDAYERGWFKSLKFNGGKLVDKAVAQPAAVPNRPTSPEYNAYAAMKGRSAPRR
jgi:hypothetical protein